MNPDSANPLETGLLLRIAQRDPQAVGLLYDCLGTWIFSLALSIVKDKRDAEEVTQEVFVQVWQQADRYKPERGSVKAWLAIITRRKAIDRTRARGYKETARTVASTEQMITTDSGPGPNGASGVLTKALKSLDDGHAEVLNLSYYEGFSHSEIAERLNLPLGTVKTRIRSGIRQLRDLLGVEI